MLKKKVILIVILLLISLISVILFNHEYYSLPDDTDLLSRQSKVDDEIKNILNDEKYSIDNPKIMVNPYFISPLTALIIFSSQSNIKFSVYINDNLYKEISGKTFIIPIVYLIEDYTNKIDLVLDDQKYTYFIKTDNISGERIEVIKKNDFNILASSTKMKNFLMNGDGKLIWYLDLDTQGLIEEFSNDTFLIGTEESILKDKVSLFTGIYEVDYLGKIRKRIDTTYGYHHEIKYLGNNNVLVLGSNRFPMDTIYELDVQTGEVLRNVNIIDLLSGGHDELYEYLSNLEYGIEANSIDYLNGDILISLRNINTILEFSYENEKINYVITNDKMVKKHLSKYVIDADISLRGEHNAKYIGDGTISLYNNGYDHVTNKSTYAEGIVLKIGSKAKIVDRYQDEKKYSYAFGSMDKSDSEAIVNYPYMYDEKPENKFLYDKYYTNLVIYDEKQVKSKFKIKDNLYRALKYDINMSDNYDIQTFKYLGGSLKCENIKIKEYDTFLDEVKLTNNSIELMIDTNNKDIDIIFKGKDTYTLKYLNTLTFFSLDDGVYQIYIRINDKYYKYSDTFKIS